MQMCCAQAAQQAVPILMNPLTWMAVLALLTAAVAKGNKK